MAKPRKPLLEAADRRLRIWVYAPMDQPAALHPEAYWELDHLILRHPEGNASDIRQFIEVPTIFHRTKKKAKKHG